MRPTPVLAVSAASAALALLCGCGASATPGTPSPTPSPRPTVGGGCPTPAAGTPLPTDVSAAFPVPPGKTLVSDTTTTEGLRVVRFTVPSSLRQGILFILDRYPKAGFVLARGDAETTEADAPFASQDGTVRGALRLVSTQPCLTTWLLAYAAPKPGQSTPAVPTYKPTSSASPLPFS